MWMPFAGRRWMGTPASLPRIGDQGPVALTVTLALAYRREFAWSRVLPYWGAQLAGAFVGACLVVVASPEIQYRVSFQTQSDDPGDQPGHRLQLRDEPFEARDFRRPRLDECLLSLGIGAELCADGVKTALQLFADSSNPRMRRQ